MPVKTERKKTTSSLWTGPEDDGPNGGVTQGLLSRFLCCRERFRLLAVEGLRPEDTFNHRMEYGSMWHVCEEAFAESKPGMHTWENCLQSYSRDLCRRYPLQQEQVQHWYNVCKVQFPLYVDHWARHPDVKRISHLFQEQTFCIPYQIPSGRIVVLRGKWDGVDLL